MSNLRSMLLMSSHSLGSVADRVLTTALLCFDIGVATRVAEQAKSVRANNMM